MLPVFLFTVRTPPATVHRAGPPLSTEAHSSRLRPSNRTSASAGGASGFVLASLPGLTMGGTGVHCSVSSGRWAMAAVALSARIGTRAGTVERREGMWVAEGERPGGKADTFAREGTVVIDSG